jgi:cytochrome c-type biogenesis protein CcmH
MRAEIETQLRSGRSPEQVRAFFVDRYGEWILLAPTRRGLNILPWAIPIVGLLVGAALWIGFVRRRTPRDEVDASTSERARIEHDLANLQEPG